MMEEVKKEVQINNKELIDYYYTQLHNTLKKLLGINVEINKGNMDQLINSTKKRYNIKDQLEAIKQTLHNIDDVLIIFDEEIKEAKQHRYR